MDPYMKVFIGATAVAVVLQMFILLALVISVRKTASRMETLAGTLQSRALPILETSNALLNDSRGKVETIVSNLADTTTTLKAQVARLDTTLTDIIDRTRLQVIRADDIVTRTLDSVEETTDIVQHTVVSPVRQISGIMQGLSVGVGAFFGNRRRVRRRRGSSSQDEELFI